MAWQLGLVATASAPHCDLGQPRQPRQPDLHVCTPSLACTSIPSAPHHNQSWQAAPQLCTSGTPDPLPPPAAGVPDVQLPTYELLFAEVLQYSMARKEDDDMRFDSGHRNPTISFDTELMTTGLLWTPDKPDSPWIEPTKPSWSRKIAALSGAVQQYLKVSYSKSQRIAPDRVADSILTYMDKLLAMKGDAAGAAEFGDKL